MLTRFHGVNNQFVADIESQNKNFQDSPFGVETQALFPLRVFLIEGLNPVWKRGNLQDVIAVDALLFCMFAWIFQILRLTPRLPGESGQNGSHVWLRRGHQASPVLRA